MKSAVLLFGLFSIVGFVRCTSEVEPSESSPAEEQSELRGCFRGQTRCSGNAVQTCRANGTFGPPVACTNQACVAGACVGVCAPGSTRCNGNAVQTCTANGTFGAATACTNQTCVSGACVGVCAPGSTQCNGNAVQTCTAIGTFGSPVACLNQVCLNGACVN